MKNIENLEESSDKIKILNNKTISSNQKNSEIIIISNRSRKELSEYFEDGVNDDQFET
jgi:hypothetical protein